MHEDVEVKLVWGGTYCDNIKEVPGTQQHSQLYIEVVYP